MTETPFPRLPTCFFPFTLFLPPKVRRRGNRLPLASHPLPPILSLLICRLQANSPYYPREESIGGTSFTGRGREMGSSESGHRNDEIDCHVRPSGMVVQRRETPDDAIPAATGPLIKIKVSYGSSHYDLSVPSHSTFGDLKKVLAHQTGLDPEDQRLFFRGREKDDAEILQAAGLKDLSKLLLMERPASKEKKMEEMKKREEMLKACEAVAQVRAEVDKLSDKVAALQANVYSGTKVDEQEFVVLTELLMRQLLKLDGIEAEGEARLQRKNEVRRVQGYVDTLDALKARNKNPLAGCSNSVSVTTDWETFDTGVGSLTPPSPASTKVTQDWQRFD